jgi:hypothetical protein
VPLTPHVVAVTVSAPPCDPLHVNVFPLNEPAPGSSIVKNESAVTSFVGAFAYVAVTVKACVNGVPGATEAVLSAGANASDVGGTQLFGPPAPLLLEAPLLLPDAPLELPLENVPLEVFAFASPASVPDPALSSPSLPQPPAVAAAATEPRRNTAQNRRLFIPAG